MLKDFVKKNFTRNGSPYPSKGYTFTNVILYFWRFEYGVFIPFALLFLFVKLTPAVYFTAISAWVLLSMGYLSVHNSWFDVSYKELMAPGYFEKHGYTPAIRNKMFNRFIFAGFAMMFVTLCAGIISLPNTLEIFDFWKQLFNI